MLRIHLLQNWFSLSDPGMEEALYEITPMRQFARLTLSGPIPEDTTIMNFRHLLEKHKLAPAILAVINGYFQEKGLSLRQGTIVDATIIHAPSSTTNEDGKRDPEMHQTKKGNQYFFGMKAHIGADVESGLVHHVHGTAANVADVTQVAELLHGEGNSVYADAGQGRTSVSGDQAPVRLCESTLPWAAEKHRSVDHAVRPVKPLDGSKTADGYGRVTRVTQRNGLKSPPRRYARDVSRQLALNVV